MATPGNGLYFLRDTDLIRFTTGAIPGIVFASTPAANGLYVSLWSTQFTASKSGASEWSSTGGGNNANYIRTAVNQGTGVAGSWTFSAWGVVGSFAQAANTSQIAFASVATNLQTLFSVGLNDAQAAGTGNIVWLADLASSSSVAVGIIVQFNALTDIILQLN